MKPLEGARINPLELHEYMAFEEMVGIRRVDNIEEISNIDAIIIKG